MPKTLPTVTRVYQHHHLDSTRWQGFRPRADDIIVSTSYKSGTTWMQQILHLLIFKDDPDPPMPVALVSPWLDARFHGPVEEVLSGLEAQTHRRFIKSHLALDGLPYYPNVKYVVVARDARDVFMSFWNHYRNYTDDMMGRLNDRTGWSGELLPAPPAESELRQTWREWITRGTFEWESEGWPFWGNLHHTQTFWPHRDLENIRLFHYADMLADLRGEIQRLADYLAIGITQDELERIAEAASFDQMKKAYEPMDARMRSAFKGGADAFLFKGTNGRWREVLEPEDLVLYDEAKARVLSPDCAAWLEAGGSGKPT